MQTAFYEMKAIMIFDIPDDMKIEDTRALNITIFNGLYIKNINIDYPLWEMPDEAAETLIKGLDAINKMKSVEVRTVRKTE